MTRLTFQTVIIHRFLLSLFSTDFFHFNLFAISFLKEHLAGLYNWTAQQGRPVFEGAPTRRLFDRDNGHQVFFIINLLLERLGTCSIEHGREIEMLIINKLPFSSCSELTVFNWLEEQITIKKV